LRHRLGLPLRHHRSVGRTDWRLNAAATSRQWPARLLARGAFATKRHPRGG
jgi:hypothetical protein